MLKLNAYLRSLNPEYLTWLNSLINRGEEVNETMMRRYSGDRDISKVLEFNARLHSLLVSCTEEDAFKIVSSVEEGEGIGAYRLIKKRYDPSTPGSKRAILMAIINNPQCKRVHDVEANLLRVEDLIRKYEAMTDVDERLPEGLKATILIALCHKELRDHLDLSIEKFTVKDVRESIINYIERKRDDVTTGLKAMEVDNVEGTPGTPVIQGDSTKQDWTDEDWQQWMTQEMNYVKGTSKGYPKGKGKGNWWGKGFQPIHPKQRKRQG